MLAIKFKLYYSENKLTIFSKKYLIPQRINRRIQTSFRIILTKIILTQFKPISLTKNSTNTPHFTFRRPNHKNPSLLTFFSNIPDKIQSNTRQQMTLLLLPPLPPPHHHECGGRNAISALGGGGVRRRRRYHEGVGEKGGNRVWWTMLEGPDDWCGKPVGGSEKSWKILFD